MQKTYAIALPPAALAVLAAAVLTACGAAMEASSMPNPATWARCGNRAMTAAAMTC
jgi:hypothetical protein